MNDQCPNFLDPFFILYDSRSGSTFLANQLARCSDVLIPPESNFLQLLLNQYEKSVIENSEDLKTVLNIIYSDPKFSDWQLSRENINALLANKLPLKQRDLIIELCKAYQASACPRAALFGVKKGNYMYHYKEIKTLFPKSKFAALIRDGRAIFNSKKTTIHSASRAPLETDPIRAAKQWTERVSTMREIQKEYPEDVLIIKYENLVTMHEGEMQRACEFLEIPYHRGKASQVAAKQYDVPQRYGSSHENIDKRPLSSRIDAWKESLTESEIRKYEMVAFAALKRENYVLENSPPSLLLYWCLCFVRRVYWKAARVARGKN